GGVERDQQRELQQHRQAAADGDGVLGHLELLHLQGAHAGVVRGDAFFLQVFEFVLQLFHFWSVARCLLEGPRLRPSQRKQQRIEQERKDDDRDAVVVRQLIKKAEGPQDHDADRLCEKSQRPIVAEIDQVDKVDAPARVGGQLRGVGPRQRKVIL